MSREFSSMGGASAVCQKRRPLCAKFHACMVKISVTSSYQRNLVPKLMARLMPQPLP